MANPFQIGCPNSPALCLKSDRLLGCSVIPLRGAGPIRPFRPFAVSPIRRFSHAPNANTFTRSLNSFPTVLNCGVSLINVVKL